MLKSVGGCNDNFHELLFCIASADREYFFKTFLVGLVRMMGLGEEEGALVLRSWPDDRSSESGNFRRGCEMFLEQYKFFQELRK